MVDFVAVVLVIGSGRQIWVQVQVPAAPLAVVAPQGWAMLLVGFQLRGSGIKFYRLRIRRRCAGGMVRRAFICTTLKRFVVFKLNGITN